MARKAKHAFGSEANVDVALRNGDIDAFDILFLDEKKIGWIDKNGEKVIIEPPKQVEFVANLPSAGEAKILYIVTDPKSLGAYVWNNSAFLPVIEGVTQETVDQKIEDALTIVEF